MIVFKISSIRRKLNSLKNNTCGAEHGLVRGIGVVNLVYSDGEDFYPIDYRIYAPEADGKTKNDHFRQLRLNAITGQRNSGQNAAFR